MRLTLQVALLILLVGDTIRDSCGRIDILVSLGGQQIAERGGRIWRIWT